MPQLLIYSPPSPSPVEAWLKGLLIPFDFAEPAPKHQHCQRGFPMASLGSPRKRTWTSPERNANSAVDRVNVGDFLGHAYHYDCCKGGGATITRRITCPQITVKSTERQSRLSKLPKKCFILPFKLRISLFRPSAAVPSTIRNEYSDSLSCKCPPENPVASTILKNAAEYSDDENWDDAAISTN